MSKYNIEGGIDFFAELYKSLDIEENFQKINEDNNICLITNEPLTENSVTMGCGHKFNYIPLYFDVKNHKQKFNVLEGSSTRLNNDEIRCPYCRTKQQGLLPYYENLGLEKLHGVNYIDPSYKLHNPLSCYYKPCQFISHNPNFDPSGNNPVETHQTNSGNCKFLKCFVLGSQLNYYHGIIEGDNFGDENFYCWHHKKIMVKKYKKAIIDKDKLEKKQALIKEKEEAKKAKQKAKAEAKEKEKEEKRKAKEDAKKNKPTKKTKLIEENVVLGPSIVVDEVLIQATSSTQEVTGCIEILKSGPNKGKKCGGKVVSDNMCKRHTNHI